MTTINIIVTIRNELIRAISGLDGWFDCEEAMLNHRSSSVGCSVRELLEHVMLTNRFLLNFIDQGSDKAIGQKYVGDISDLLKDYSLESQVLAQSGMLKSLDMTEHDPAAATGKASLPAVRREIREQLDRCLIHLELLKNGEGILYKTSISVDGSAKLDVYQNIYLLVLHARRNLDHLNKIKAEFQKEVS